jgi:phosphatidate cytidylyltransferase
MLKTRIITAVVLISILLLVLFYLPPAPFCLLTAFIILAGAWEWSGLIPMPTVSLRISYVAMIAILLFAALFIPAPLICLVALCWWIVSLPCIIFYPRASVWFQKNIFLRSTFGVLVLVPAWAAVNFIRVQNDGVFALLFLFVLVWGADTAA